MRGRAIRTRTPPHPIRTQTSRPNPRSRGRAREIPPSKPFPSRCRGAGMFRAERTASVTAKSVGGWACALPTTRSSSATMTPILLPMPSPASHAARRPTLQQAPSIPDGCGRLPDRPDVCGKLRYVPLPEHLPKCEAAGRWMEAGGACGISGGYPEVGNKRKRFL
jgi:hypothetical protein